VRNGYIALLALLLSPAAVAECLDPLIEIGGTPAAVLNSDRRELEQFLGTQLDAVVCGRMQPTRGYKLYFADRGFFVLTADEALFVSDRKVKEVLFRTHFTGVRHMVRRAFADMQFLDLTTGTGHFEFQFSCEVIAGRIVDELERRAPGKTQVLTPRTGPLYSCD